MTRLWRHHPGVRSGDELTRGERAADRMKAVLATWSALAAVCALIVVWMATNGAGIDRFPWILLNLCLSCFAALQCFVLLIANKRGEQIAAELAMHDHRIIADLHELIRCVHATPETGPCTCRHTNPEGASS